MSGNYAGDLKAAQTNKERYGENFYKELGRKGGQVSRGGGFAANRDLAREAGRKGGLKSKRTKQLDEVSPTEFLELEQKTQEQAHKSWRERIGL